VHRRVPNGSTDGVAGKTSGGSTQIDTTLRAELLRLEIEDQKGREDVGALLERNDTAALFRFMRADSARTNTRDRTVSTMLREMCSGYFRRLMSEREI
jgi:hypothetical protein